MFCDEYLSSNFEDKHKPRELFDKITENKFHFICCCNTNQESKIENFVKYYHTDILDPILCVYKQDPENYEQIIENKYEKKINDKEYNNIDMYNGLIGYDTKIKQNKKGEITNISKTKRKKSDIVKISLNKN